MAAKVRLRILTVVAIICSFTKLTVALRYGSAARTLHIHKVNEEEYLGKGVRSVTVGERDDRTQNVKHRSRRAATAHETQYSTAFELNDTNYQMIIHWAGKDSDVIVALTRDILPTIQSTTHLYISNNYGTTFQKKDLNINSTTKAILDRFYNSPVYNSHYIFTDVFHNLTFTTTDYGNTINTYWVPFAPRQISPHPKNYNILLGHDEEDPQKRLYVSRDFGANWEVIQVNVKSFFWGEDGIDPENTLYVERQEADGTSFLINTTSFFDHEYNTVFRRAKDFQISKKYIFATKAGTNGMELWVSLNRGQFKQAMFPHNATALDFFIADASEDAVLVCVAHNRTVSNLYVSDPSGIQYSLSLRQVLYYNPDLQSFGSILRYLAKEPFADVHTVDGLRGVYIASTLANETSPTKSYISHNMGGDWYPLAPPQHDFKGRPYRCAFNMSLFWEYFHPHCSLHLAQRYHAFSLETRAPPILSKSSAVGLILGTGVVNNTMSTDMNVYLSTDGGFVWHEVMQEPHYYAFGDHGGIIVAVNMRNFTKEVLYSTDEGETWQTTPFSDEELRVYGILTEPGEKTMIFSIFGSHRSNHSWIIVKLDMTHVFMVNCSKEDYKEWSPSSTGRDECLLGRKTVYDRRLPHSQCFNGEDYERAISVVNCPCKVDDYECDFGFMKQYSWSAVCVFDPDEGADAHLVPDPCPLGEYYNRTKGYRKVSGDTCAGGDAFRFDPDPILCPVQEAREFMLYASTMGIHQVGLSEDKSDILLPLGSISNIEAIDYDYNDNCLYWVDGRDNIIKRNCLNGTRGTEVVVQENTDQIESLALDWITNNIFWLESGKDKRIEVASTAHLDEDLDSKIPLHRRVIVSQNNASFDTPKSLVVYPKYGYLFWADHERNKARINRAWMDGKNVTALVTQAMVMNMQKPQGLTIDPQHDVLYWVDAVSREIWHVSVYGVNVQPVRLMTNVDAFYLSIFKDDLYFADYKAGQIEAVNKYQTLGTVSRHAVLQNVRSVSDLKIFSRATQHGDTPCSRSNGHCSSICVERPNNDSLPLPLNRTCLCAQFYASVQKDSSANEKCLCSPGERPVNKTCMASVNGTCAPGQFTCGNNRCIPGSWRCDRDNDCGDMSDEFDCPYHTCSEQQFSCKNGRCIPLHWKCDHDDDCGDGSDEAKNCQFVACNSSTQFQCGNNRCIPKHWQCDGDDDCHDFSDEDNCNSTHASQTSCTSTGFQCNNGQCILSIWVCDGDNDCVDNSDENNCNMTAGTCAPWQFTCGTGMCIERSWVCDEQPDCPDSSDESHCVTTRRPETSTVPGCPGQFMCANRLCIAYPERCDGINDCGDNSDEFHCGANCPPGHKRCDSGECLSVTHYCDGVSQCIDGSDEFNCLSTPASTTCSALQYHCYRGGLPRCIYQSWVCDNATDCENGEDEVNCKKQGPICNLTTQFKCYSDNTCIPLKWVCDGDVDCPDHSDEDCNNSTGAPFQCSSSEFQCSNGKCINLANVCDGHEDCPSGSDEDKCQDAVGVTDIHILEVKNTSVTLRWQAHSRNPGRPWQVMIMYRPAEISSWKNSTLYSSNMNPIEIKDLSPATNYVFTAAVVQENVTTAPVVFRPLTTPPGAPDAPVLVAVTLDKDGNFEVTWNTPVHKNGKLTKFEVFVQDTKESVPQSREYHVRDPDAKQYKETVPGLERGKTYKIWVVAYTLYPSAPSNSKLFSDTNAITICIDMKIEEKDDSMVISLLPREPLPDNVEGIMLYSSSEETMREEHVSLHKNATNYTFANLGPGMTYEIWAVAHNTQSYGPICDKPYAVTSGNQLRIQASDIHITSLAETSFHINWKTVYDKQYTYALYYTTETKVYDEMNFYQNKEQVHMKVVDGSYLQLDNLQSCEVYFVKLQTIKPYIGILSETAEFQTAEDPKAPPEDVQLHSYYKGDEAFLQVSWEAPCPQSTFNLSYTVQLEEIENEKVVFRSGYPTGSQKPSENITITIANLTRGALYNVSVTSHISQYSSPKTIHIAPYGAPIDLKIESVDDNKGHGYVLSWSPPAYAKGNVLYRVYRAKDTAGQQQQFEMVASMSSTSYLISHLDPGRYLFKVNIREAMGTKYPSAFSDTEELNIPAASKSSKHTAGSKQGLSKTMIGLIALCVVVVILLSAALMVAVLRNRRLQRSFLSYANSHYDTRSGTTTFNTDLAEEEEPMIRGFSDDEPLVIA